MAPWSRQASGGSVFAVPAVPIWESSRLAGRLRLDAGVQWRRPPSKPAGAMALLPLARDKEPLAAKRALTFVMRRGELAGCRRAGLIRTESSATGGSRGGSQLQGRSTKRPRPSPPLAGWHGTFPAAVPGANPARKRRIGREGVERGGIDNLDGAAPPPGLFPVLRPRLWFQTLCL